VRNSSSRRAFAAVHIKLPELGIRGNGHVMMLENNLDIAKVIVDWLDQHVGQR
jgi:hypothetical protein